MKTNRKRLLPDGLADRKPLWLGSLAAAALWLGASGTVKAGPPDPATFLRARHDAIQRILRQPPASQANQLDQAVEQLLDFEELSRRSLADHWNRRSAAERREFVSLLRQLVQRNYQRNLKTTLNYDVRYQGASSMSEGVVVHTVARTRRNRRAPEITIDYALRPEGQQWKVFDVTTDGVSLVRNYRSQFNRIIQREGWAELIRRMRNKLSVGDGDF